MSTTNEMPEGGYTRKDFISNQQPRWCSGCGDYFILQALTGTFAQLGIPRENFLVVSGIGCSSRFPYYAETFGFHTIHGRAPTVALGAALTNPDLSVWVITGDGDGMSIGGNHLIHTIRRNLNINIVLFNNEIYGLTKGQASPTSAENLRTKSTPYGSKDQPLNPIKLALAADASFVARTIDTNLPHMKEVFTAAYEHQGTSFVEVYTNCVVFNDGAFAEVESRKNWAEKTLKLSDGEPLQFGRGGDKTIVMDGWLPKVVPTVEADKYPKLDHHLAGQSPLYPQMLASLALPEFPLPIGVLRQTNRVTMAEGRDATIAASQAKKVPLDALFASGETW